MQPSPDITHILERWGSGEESALEELLVGFANARDMGVIKNAELNAAVRTFLAARRDPPPVAQ